VHQQNYGMQTCISGSHSAWCHCQSQWRHFELLWKIHQCLTSISQAQQCQVSCLRYRESTQLLELTSLSLLLQNPGKLDSHQMGSFQLVMGNCSLKSQYQEFRRLRRKLAMRRLQVTFWLDQYPQNWSTQKSETGIFASQLWQVWRLELLYQGEHGRAKST